MKRDKIIENDELRDEYKYSDFPYPLVRGKYVQRMTEASNIVALKPEVTKAFPNEEAVNYALPSIIKLTQAITFTHSTN